MPNKKKTSKKVSKQEVVIRVENNSIPVIRSSDLSEPLKDGGKHMIPKSWISERQAINLVGKTNPKYIYTRPGKGGGKFEYVPGWYVTKMLNFIFGWHWDFEVIREGREGDQVYVLGKLTVKDEKGNYSIVKTQYGRADVKFKKDTKVPLDYGNDLKAAATDCLKKCASLLGFASDVYGKEEMKRDVGIDVKDDQREVPGTKKGTGPNGEVTCLCSNCGDPIDKAVNDFSIKIFKKALCRECQGNAKKK